MNKKFKNKKTKKRDVFSFKPQDVFRFIPEFAARVMPDGKPVNFDCPCFKNNTAVLTKTSEGYLLEITSSHKTSAFCTDGLLMGSIQSIYAHYTFFEGTHKINWNGEFSTDSQFDIERNGFRIFRFLHSEIDTIYELWETFEMFIGGFLGRSDPDWTAEDNLEFMKYWMNVTMEDRPVNLVNVSKSLISSGDFLGVIRLDGLDPMLAYGMGSHTGHTAIAMWIDGVLHVCESTKNSNYWPTNGIQKTPWDTWIKQAMEASYNVVWLPMNEQSKAKFNVQKAIDYFNKIEGLPYGFHNMLFGWLDTINDNLPFPLSRELFTIGLPIALDYLELDETTDIAKQALNFRLGTKNLTVRQCYTEAAKRGMSFGELYIKPEQDSWMYKFADGRSGPSLVCDCLVSALWKAGGLFGNYTDQIQITEFTNWDAYSLNFFNGSFVRPQECVVADPDLPFCQLMGKYRMHLPGYNTAAPFPHMRENCPSLAPYYNRPPTC